MVEEVTYQYAETSLSLGTTEPKDYVYYHIIISGASTLPIHSIRYIRNGQWFYWS